MAQRAPPLLSWVVRPQEGFYRSLTSARFYLSESVGHFVSLEIRIVRHQSRPSFCLWCGVAVLIALGCQRRPPDDLPVTERTDSAAVTPSKAVPTPTQPKYKEVAIVASFTPAPGADEMSWNTHIDATGRVDQQAHDPNPRVVGENHSTRSLPQLDAQRLEALVGRIESLGFFSLRGDYPTNLVLPVNGPSYTLSVQFARSEGVSRHHLVMVVGDGGKHPDVAKFWASWKAVLEVAPPQVRGRR